MTDFPRPEVIFTDVDDTLTLHGELPVVALDALYRLRAASIEVIPVTGACAGWCDQIARLWPVSAVIGENGAFCIEKRWGELYYLDTQHSDERLRHQQSLKTLAQRVIDLNPKLHHAQDNVYRRYDWAIDYNQHSRGVTRAEVEDALEQIHRSGVQATASSIHINLWLGDNNKCQGALDWLARNRPDWSQQDILTRCAYVGDSLNDEPMFAYFPNSIGVANVIPYLGQMQHKPATIMTKEGGEGFAEWVDLLLTRALV